jgi:large subunit ribosomal protein L5
MINVSNNEPRLKHKYEKEIVPQMSAEFGIKNVMAVPKITKIVVNTGIGNIAKDKEALNLIRKDLSDITGQQPSIRNAKISVSSFNLRRGMPVGLKVTLRGNKMYSFLDKLISVVLPRLRDFRGVSLNSFDKNGNYSVGIHEHIVFPEIDFSKTSPRGLEVTIVTNVNDKEQSRRLLELIGMPFEKD